MQIFIDDEFENRLYNERECAETSVYTCLSQIQCFYPILLKPIKILKFLNGPKNYPKTGGLPFSKRCPTNKIEFRMRGREYERGLFPSLKGGWGISP